MKNNDLSVNNENSRFAERLNSLMKERGISQSIMAEIIGVTQQAVGKYISGHHEPSYQRLIKIAKYFNVTTDYLLGISDEPGPYKIKVFVFPDNDEKFNGEHNEGN